VQDVYANTTLSLTVNKPQATNFHFQSDAEPILKKFLSRFFWSRSASKVENVKLMRISVVSNKFETLEDETWRVENETIKDSSAKVKNSSCDVEEDAKACAPHDATCTIFIDALIFVGVVLLFVGFGYLNYVMK
jgi:hypothetical protein